jgi:YceI-like domain
MRARHAIVLFALLVTACAPQVRQPESAGNLQPADFPEAYYREAAAQGRTVLRIDPAGSLVVIEVRRAGSLARYGHDHVVASHDVRGYVAPGAGRSDFYIPLERLVVDEPALRAESGFDTQPSEPDIAGTRSNMLDKVLDAREYPFAVIRVTGAGGTSGTATLRVAIVLHGVEREVQVPANIESGPGELVASGRFSLNQTDFGLVPFSILGGAIQVQDRLELRFRIRALRTG